ncbi:sortase [Candidatus Microgenomates bacterium]|jgi:sortase A|nr:MAG: sortase [Candidatus Microgenomates bacterium]
MEIILYEAKDKKSLVLKEFTKLSFINSKAAAEYLGYSFLAASLMFLLVGFAPIIKEEAKYQLKRLFTFSAPEASVESVFFENSKKIVEEEAAKYGVDTDFSLVIPKISATSKIIANVDPADENKYKELLKTGVAHATGTKFPGNNGTIYLFAHSTNNPENIVRYNAVFYLLKELEPEDEVIVFFAGQKFVYKVTKNFIAEAGDLKWLSGDENEEKLILQTCWPPGTTFKRLIVEAKPL